MLKGQRSSGLWDNSYRTNEGGDDIEASIWQVLALKQRATCPMSSRRPLWVPVQVPYHPTRLTP
jgi:hypothetical protein